MKKIKIALIGLGHLGSRHLKVLTQLKDKVEIIGICDNDPEKAKALSEQYHLPCNIDYKTILSTVDAVDICVPTSLHFKIGKYSLAKGLHTFIEKPITPTIKEADQLIKLAQKNKVKLQVGHVERFNSAFASASKIIDKPLFIECHRLNLFPNRSLDIGVVMDLMIHDIDIILGLIKSPIKDIQAVGVKVLTNREDIASARIAFKNGCVCNLTASRVSDDVMRKIRIFQKDTYISLDYVKQEAFLYKKENNQINKRAIPIEKEEPLKKELEHFIDCSLENKNPLVGGVEARQALSVALEITKKIRKNLSR